MPKVLDDVMAAYGDWWWRLRTPEGSRAWVFERDGSFYNKYRARLWRTTDAGRGFIYAGGDLVIVPYSFAHKVRYEIERVAETEVSKSGMPIGLEHGRPKDAKAVALLAEYERGAIKRELTGVELGVYDGEWLIGVVNGEMIACPFRGTGVPMDVDELEEFFHSHVMTDLATEYERLRAGGMGNVLRTLLIIAGVAVIGFLIYHFTQHHAALAPGNITPTITPMPQGTPIFSMLRAVSGV
jgi:hypothetical protein